MFDKVLNMLLLRLSYGCFIVKSIWISKLADNPLGKTKKKEPVELQKSWTKILLKRTNS